MRWVAILCVCLLTASAIELVVMDGGCWAACAGEEAEQADAPDPCSHCGPGCCAVPFNVAPTAFRIAAADLAPTITQMPPTGQPPAGELREILHVPRSARA